VKAEGMRAVVARGACSLAIAAVVLAAVSSAAAAQEKDIVVFAAASLKNALDDADGTYERDSHHKVKVSYAASSTLAKQIEASAPADVFISADLDWMDYLATRKLIKPDTRSNLLGNRIVLIAPVTSTVSVTVGPDFPLAKVLASGRLAMADPASVPAGKYGKAALEKLGVWTSVADKVAPAENVRAALILVARGEAALGIVYRTDAAAEKDVKIVGVFPASSHPPIIYPIAVTAASDNPAAAAYVEFLKSKAAAPAFEKQGFILLD
jgi:molybdate transport system substrate-binding protein